MLDCGAAVNGMDVVEPALWKEFRDARAAGVLVMNCDHPGLYLAHTSHVDVPAAVPKYVAPYRVNLAERCGNARRRLPRSDDSRRQRTGHGG